MANKGDDTKVTSNNIISYPWSESIMAVNIGSYCNQAKSKKKLLPKKEQKNVLQTNFYYCQ